MPRSNWKGVISFGLVSIPVALYPAKNKSADISFHQIDRWKYGRSFVADGNFKCVHQQQSSREEEVWLKNGEGIFTERTQYGAHIAHTKETVEVRETTNPMSGISNEGNVAQHMP